MSVHAWLTAENAQSELHATLQRLYAGARSVLRNPLGVAGLITFLVLPRRYVFRHGAVLLGATVVLYLLASDGVVSREEGLAMITLYAIYVFARRFLPIPRKVRYLDRA